MKQLLLGVLYCALATTSVPGQASYVFSVHDATAPHGTIFTQDVSLQVINDWTVGGWSLSVCHDPTAQDVCGVAHTPFALTINPLAPPFFAAVAIDNAATNIPGSTDGASQGIVVDQCSFLGFFPNGPAHTTMVVSYVALTAAGTADTAVCSSVGNPPVEAVVVCCGGASVTMTDPSVSTNKGTVTFTPAVPQWTFSADDISVEYSTESGELLTNCSVDLVIANTAANTTHRDTAGYSVSLVCDPSLLVPTGATIGALPASLDQAVTSPPTAYDFTCGGGGGLGPDIVLTNITNNGISIHVQNTEFPSPAVFPYCLKTIDWGAGNIAATIDFDVNPTALADNHVGAATTLGWDDIGDGVGNAIIMNCPGDYLVALTSAGAIVTHEIDICFVPVTNFLRGDCNNDGAINITDAVWFIDHYLALPPIGPEGPCPAASDVNNDTLIDIADLSYLLGYLFALGPPPSAPFPACGNDPTADCDGSICP
ncbi:MAG: dockerin type I repeat-containing protein [Planctomycetota bacterium]